MLHPVTIRMSSSFRMSNGFETMIVGTTRGTKVVRVGLSEIQLFIGDPGAVDDNDVTTHGDEADDVGPGDGARLRGGAGHGG